MAAAIVQQPQRKASRLPQPRASHAWLAAGLLLTGWYLAGPLMTVWRIEHAIRQSNGATLQALIDWASVRQGLKEDVAEGLLGLPQKAAASGDELPPFGSGFMSGIAGSEIEHDVTPHALLAAAALLDHGRAGGLGAFGRSLRGAAFVAPDTFDLRIGIPGEATDEPPLHIRLKFRGWKWRVVRVWIPQDLMDDAAGHT